MSEYIDREKIMLKTCSDCTRQVDLVCKHPEPCGKLISAFLCEEQEDVAPVVHGKWEFKSFYKVTSRGVFECQNCKGAFEGSIGFNYCPNCGAKMDLTDD